MLDQVTRSLKDSLLTPLERVIPHGLHPDTITWVSLIPGLAAALLAGVGLTGWAVAAFVANRILDGLDGLLARRRHLQSDFGGYLDIIVDFVVYAAIPIGVWYGAAGGAGALPLVLLLSVFYVNGASWMYLSAVLEKRRPKDGEPSSSRRSEHTTVTMPRGVVEGTETVIFFTLFLLIPRLYVLLFSIMTALTAAGVVQRLVWAYRNIR